MIAHNNNPNRNGGPHKRKRPKISEQLAKLPPNAGRRAAKLFADTILLRTITGLRKKQNAGKITDTEKRELRFRLLEAKYTNIDPRKPENQETIRELFTILQQEVLQNVALKTKKMPTTDFKKIVELSEKIWRDRAIYMKKYKLTTKDIEFLTKIEFDN